jgi:hypothetical protein
MASARQGVSASVFYHTYFTYAHALSLPWRLPDKAFLPARPTARAYERTSTRAAVHTYILKRFASQGCPVAKSIISTVPTGIASSSTHGRLAGGGHASELSFSNGAGIRCRKLEPTRASFRTYGTRSNTGPRSQSLGFHCGIGVFCNYRMQAHS